MANKLEHLIVSGVIEAFEFYNKASGGHMLHHAPEHLIEVFVAQELYRSGRYFLYLDASVKKIMAEDENSDVADIPSDIAAYRPDLTIWRKNGNVAALLEIKRTWSAGPLISDRDKLSAIEKTKLVDASTSYILAYTAASVNNRSTDPAKIIENRFKDWEEKTRWKCVSNHISDLTDDLVWGCCLLRNQHRVE